MKELYAKEDVDKKIIELMNLHKNILYHTFESMERIAKKNTEVIDGKSYLRITKYRLDVKKLRQELFESMNTCPPMPPENAS